MVPAAARAMVFGAFGEQRVVHFRTEHAGKGSEKTGPARTAVVLHFGSEQRQITARAMVGTGALFGVEWAEWIGRLSSRNLSLLRVVLRCTIIGLEPDACAR